MKIPVLCEVTKLWSNMFTNPTTSLLYTSNKFIKLNEQTYLKLHYLSSLQSVKQISGRISIYLNNNKIVKKTKLLIIFFYCLTVVYWQMFTFFNNILCTIYSKESK